MSVGLCTAIFQHLRKSLSDIFLYNKPRDVFFIKSQNSFSFNNKVLLSYLVTKFTSLEKLYGWSTSVLNFINNNTMVLKHNDICQTFFEKWFHYPLHQTQWSGVGILVWSGPGRYRSKGRELFFWIQFTNSKVDPLQIQRTLK